MSRVKHPDDLMLDDDFPDYATILRGARHESFKKRQIWEKRARSYFSRTIRTHMRDPSKYSEARRWTEEESDQADLMLTLWKKYPKLSDDEVVKALMDSDSTISKNLLMTVLQKLATFPHMFEVAHAKKQLFTLNRDGTLAAAATTDNDDEPVNHLTLAGFSVRLDDYSDYISTRNVSPALWHHFLQVLRKNSPSNFKWHPTNIAKNSVDKLEATFDVSSKDDEQIVYDCFTHCPKGHLRTIFVVARRATCDKMAAPTELHMFQHGHIFDTTTQQTEKNTTCTV